ncbi:MAG: GDP-mannose 4,6-dehydratase [Solirubrobacterales bacterium]
MVLGATGFIGSSASRQLGGSGHQTIGTSTSGKGADVACDILLPESVDRVLEKSQPEAILLAAGRASVADSWKDPDGTFRTNTAGAFNVLDGMRRICPSAQLVFASTASVYGRPASPDEMPFTEDVPARPSSPYAASKAAAEVLCRQFELQYGLDLTVLRFFNQIGPGQTGGQAPVEFASGIAAAEKRGEQRYYLKVGNPKAERDFTDVRDSARAIEGVISQRVTGTFNVCSGQAVSLKQIIEILTTASQIEIGMLIDPQHSHREDIPVVFGAPGKLRDAIGWQPSIPLNESLEELLADWRTRT